MSVEMLGEVYEPTGRFRVWLPCGHGRASLDPHAGAHRRHCPVCRDFWQIELDPSDTYATFAELVAAVSR